MESPFLVSLPVTSLALPVSEPSGSPLACASEVGIGTCATSASVIGFGAGVAGAAAAGTAAGAAAGAWAKPTGAKQSATSRNVSSLFVVIFILASPLLPDCVLQIGLVKHTDDSKQAHRQTQKDDHHPGADGVQSKTEDADYEPEQSYKYSAKNHVSLSSILRVFQRLTLSKGCHRDPQDHRRHQEEQNAPPSIDGAGKRGEPQQKGTYSYSRCGICCHRNPPF